MGLCVLMTPVPKAPLPLPRQLPRQLPPPPLVVVIQVTVLLQMLCATLPQWILSPAVLRLISVGIMMMIQPTLLNAVQTVPSLVMFAMIRQLLVIPRPAAILQRSVNQKLGTTQSSPASQKVDVLPLERPAGPQIRPPY